MSPLSPALQGYSLLLSHQGSPWLTGKELNCPGGGEGTMGEDCGAGGGGGGYELKEDKKDKEARRE